jgi:hypothetical protein
MSKFEVMATVWSSEQQNRRERTMRKIQWTEDELQSINLHGETCDAVARAAMQRSGLNFDDIEQINGHYETHRWGSDADRRYRKAAVNKAVRRVAVNPLMYAAPRQEEAAAMR